MIIEKILKQLTPERVKKEVAAIQAIKLPPEIQKWVKEYEKVGDRSNFTWKIIYKMLHLITFPIVKKDYLETLITTKFLALMIFTVLLNDAADRLKNKKLINALSDIILRKNFIQNGFNNSSKRYLFLVKKLWKHVFSRIKRTLRFAEFEEILNFDILQIINANHYDYLQGKYSNIANDTESWIYPPHTMAAIMCCDLDLMCCPQFNMKEIGKIREIFLQIQKMARIGNWISSWKRELEENDFTSGIFTYAMNSKIIKPRDFKNKIKLREKIIKNKIEEMLIKEWAESYKKIKKLGSGINSLNTKLFLPRLEKLFVLELCLKN